MDRTTPREGSDGADLRDVGGAELRESGLLLRTWRRTDATAVHRACQDPAIQRWSRIPSPYLPEHALGFVTEIATREWANGTGAHFAVCDVETGELLGSCGLVTIDHRLGSAEIGYWTAPWARGRGVAVRATRTVSRWAFEELGLRRLVWQAELGNHASRLVALRAGFRVEGRIRLAERHHDGGQLDGWVGSLHPSDLIPPDGTPPDLTNDSTGRDCTGHAESGHDTAGRGSIAARRAAVFGRPQPVLFAEPRWRHAETGGAETGGGRPPTGAASCQLPAHEWAGLVDLRLAGYEVRPRVGG